MPPREGRMVICPRCRGPVFYPRHADATYCDDGHDRIEMLELEEFDAMKAALAPPPPPASPRPPDHRPTPRWKLRST